MAKKKKINKKLIKQGIQMQVADGANALGKGVMKGVGEGIRTMSVAKGLKAAAANTVANINPAKQFRGTAKVVKGLLGNAPEWYTHLGLHTEFKIPDGYPKQFGYNGQSVPTIMMHDVVLNQNSDNATRYQRDAEIFSLVKHVRGLSSVSYTVNTVRVVREITLLALIKYYTLKKVLRAVKTYQLQNPGLAEMICHAYNYDYNDVVANMPAYRNSLCIFRNIIRTNTVVLNPILVERVKYLIEACMPDSDDPVIATTHMFDIVCMYYQTYDSDNNPEINIYRENDSHLNNFDSLTNDIQMFLNYFTNSSLVTEFIADAQGAFGDKAVWDDAAIADVDKELEFTNYTGVSKMQLENADILMKSYLGLTRTRINTVDDDEQPIQEYANFVDQLVVGASVDNVTYHQEDNGDITVLIKSGVKSHEASLVSGTTTKVEVFTTPDYLNGDVSLIRQSSLTTEGNHDYTREYGDLSRSVNLANSINNEGECYDILQFVVKHIETKCEFENESNDATHMQIVDKYKTGLTAILRSYVYYSPTKSDKNYDASTFYRYTSPVGRNILNIQFTGVSSISLTFNNQDDIIGLLSKIDWNPIRYYHSQVIPMRNANVEFSSGTTMSYYAMIDINKIGDLSAMALKVLFYNSMYSLLAPISIESTKYKETFVNTKQNL